MTTERPTTVDHPARRKEIVDAARSLAAEQGWAAVTLRALAGRIGCSAPAIYQYFRDKDAVLAALAADGHAALSASLDHAADPVHGPAKRLRAAVRAMWSFALDNPELYAVMFGLGGLTAHRNTVEPGVAPPALRRISADLLAKRGGAEAASDLADRIAATTHGFVSLTLAGGFPGGGDRAFNLLSRAIDAMLKDLARH